MDATDFSNVILEDAPDLDEISLKMMQKWLIRRK